MVTKKLFTYFGSLVTILCVGTMFDVSYNIDYILRAKWQWYNYFTSGHGLGMLYTYHFWGWVWFVFTLSGSLAIWGTLTDLEKEQEQRRGRK